MKYVKTVCPFCHKETILEMTDKQYELINSTNGYIQDIFPDWSVKKREILISGMCEECQSKFF